MEQRMGDRQRWLWLLSGISAAAAACACGLGWLWVLVGSIPAALYYLYMDRRSDSGGAAALLMEAFGKGGKVLIGAALLWTVIAMAWTAQLENFRNAYPEAFDKNVHTPPMGYFGDPEADIGRVCVQLAHPDFKYMTGETLTLEGGLGLRP